MPPFSARKTSASAGQGDFQVLTIADLRSLEVTGDESDRGLFDEPGPLAV